MKLKYHLFPDIRVYELISLFLCKKTALENLSKRFRYTLYRGRTTSTTFNTFLLYRPLTISVPTDCRHARTHIHTHGRARWAYIESCATSINFTAVVVLLFCEWLCMWNTSVMIYGGNNFATRIFFSVTTETTSVAWNKKRYYRVFLPLLILLVSAFVLGS